MRKKILSVLLGVICLFAATSCQMENMIPDQEDTISLFQADESVYIDCVNALATRDFDCLISRPDFYAPEGSENFTGLYIQNMSTMEVQALEEKVFDALFSQTDVKLVDRVQREDLTIVAFDMCIPGRNFDYGIYYVSEDRPVYLGDPQLEMVEQGDGGFAYEKSASYGTKFTYYTKKLSDHFYYYEIM